jgi:hypothetical protein
VLLLAHPTTCPPTEQRKPWGELLDRSSFSKPATMQEAVSRLRRNAGYFRVNYLIVAVLTIAGSFITHPSSLLVLVGLAALWVYMFALKQGPLVLGDREFRCVSGLCVTRCPACVQPICAGWAGLTSWGLQLTPTHRVWLQPCVLLHCSEREKLAGMLAMSFLVVFFFSK